MPEKRILGFQYLSEKRFLGLSEKRFLGLQYWSEKRFLGFHYLSEKRFPLFVENYFLWGFTPKRRMKNEWNKWKNHFYGGVGMSSHE